MPLVSLVTIGPGFVPARDRAKSARHRIRYGVFKGREGETNGVASTLLDRAVVTADFRGTEIARLQHDAWTLWRAISRRGSRAPDTAVPHRTPDTVGSQRGIGPFRWRVAAAQNAHAQTSGPMSSLVDSEALATCLGWTVDEILDDPGRLATLLDLHEKLSALVYPATPDSIRLSEAYEGAPRPRGVEPSDWSVGRLVFRLRIVFFMFTTFALIALALAVFISVQAATGTAALSDASQAIEDAASVRVHNSTTRPQGAVDAQTQIDTQTSVDAARDAALQRLVSWNSSRYVERITGTSASANPETAAGTAASDLALMTTILLPMLGGFLGAYCEFVRWFTRRLLALALTPADHMQIVVRFMLALAATSVLAAFARGFTLPPTLAFMPFAAAFFLGYMVSQLFGALDRVLGSVPAFALASTVAQATRGAIEQTQSRQLTAITGSLEAVIGRKLGVPEVVAYQGQFGIDLLDAADNSRLTDVATDNDGPIAVTLTASQPYVLLAQIGPALSNLPVIRHLSVAEGKAEADITFEVELESDMLPGHRLATIMASPKPDAVWSHRFTLTAPPPLEGARMVAIWLTVRQLGITYCSISLSAVVLPAPVVMNPGTD